MVDRLSHGPASVGELARPMSMSLAAVVQHLQILEQCGLIRTEKFGRIRTCRLEPAGMRAAEQWISERRTLWQGRLDRLGEYFAKQESGKKESRKRKKRETPSVRVRNRKSQKYKECVYE
jgi:DNA-binding transcriptional ArsR family regulator